jgi:hypothetical protein
VNSVIDLTISSLMALVGLGGSAKSRWEAGCFWGEKAEALSRDGIRCAIFLWLGSFRF